jgi:subtilisin family serine protease
MKRRTIYSLLLLVVVAVAAAAQERVPQWEIDAQEVISNAKIADQDAAMEAFYSGNGKGRFIVHLKARPIAANEPLRREERKRERRMEVNSVRERAFSQMPAFPRNAVRRLYDNFFSFSVEVTPEELQLLINNPDIRSIEPVFPLYPYLAQGISVLHGYNFRSRYNGQGLSVAVCDTGIDYTNTYLGGGGFPNSKVIGGYDVGENDSNPIDINGHGTACAGIVAGALGTNVDYIGGVAYNAKLYALKISLANGTSSNEIIADAWDWCVTHQNDNPSYPIMIITTSFGGGKYTSNCDSDPSNESMTNAARNAKAAGITVFAASGNDGYCNALGSPACISHVISVGAVYDANFGIYQPCISLESCAPTKVISSGCTTGAYANDTTEADKVTSFSNSASFLNLLAPSKKAHTLGLTSGFNTSFGGTSAACPYAAGAAAALQSAAKERTGSWLTPDQVNLYLTTTGNLITDGKNGITKPRVNLEAAIKALPGAELDLTPIISFLLDEAIPPAPDPPNTLRNGDFELGSTVGWTQSSSLGNNLITTSFPQGVAPHSGAYAVWLVRANTETTSISQSVTVPSASPYLSFYHWVQSAESSCSWDYGYVRINGVSVSTLGLCSTNNTGGWVARSINLSAYAGQTVILEFRSVTDSSIISNWFIDDVSFRSTALAGSEVSTFMTSSEGASSDEAGPKVK